MFEGPREFFFRNFEKQSFEDSFGVFLFKSITNLTSEDFSAILFLCNSSISTVGYSQPYNLGNNNSTYRVPFRYKATSQKSVFQNGWEYTIEPSKTLIQMQNELLSTLLTLSILKMCQQLTSEGNSPQVSNESNCRT